MTKSEGKYEILPKRRPQLSQLPLFQDHLTHLPGGKFNHAYIHCHPCSLALALASLSISMPSYQTVSTVSCVQ